VEKTVNRKPSVTIAIPVLNEENFIEDVIQCFLGMGYPNLKEIIIADGGSTDSTIEIVKKLEKKYDKIKLLNNSDKFQSFALNQMIELAEGEVFLRADGHCEYDINYIENCVEALLTSNARNVGGSQRYKAKNVVQSGIALAVQSFFGNGGAKYMDQTFEGFGDTVFLGCFWTEDLKKIGGFSTKNVTNQDSELNLRLIEKYGASSIFITPKIKSWYYPRANFLDVFKQYFKYGRGRFITSSIHNGEMPFRTKAPIYLIITLITFYLIDLIIFKWSLASTAISLSIISIFIFESIRVCIEMRKVFDKEIWDGEEDKKPGTLTNIINVFFSILLINLSYFCGYIYQFLRKNILNVEGW